MTEENEPTKSEEKATPEAVKDKETHETVKPADEVIALTPDESLMIANLSSRSSNPKTLKEGRAMVMLKRAKEAKDPKAIIACEKACKEAEVAGNKSRFDAKQASKAERIAEIKEEMEILMDPDSPAPKVQRSISRVRPIRAAKRIV